MFGECSMTLNILSQLSTVLIFWTKSKVLFIYEAIYCFFRKILLSRIWKIKSFRPGSNWRLSACKADVITTTPRKLLLECKLIFFIEQADDQEVSFFYFCLICVYDCLYGTKKHEWWRVGGSSPTLHWAASSLE